MAGLPRAFAAPWERVGLSAPIPVADAVRERRLVWVGGEEEMARRYPRIAVVLPYPFALAAVPVATESTVYGAVFVTWPGSHPPELSDWERDHLTAACDRLALRLERAPRAHPAAPRARHARRGDAGSPARSARGRGGADGGAAAVRAVLAGSERAGRLRQPRRRRAARGARSASCSAASCGGRALAERPGVRGPLPGRAAQPAAPRRSWRCGRPATGCRSGSTRAPPASACGSPRRGPAGENRAAPPSSRPRPGSWPSPRC